MSAPVDSAAKRPALELRGVVKDFAVGIRGVKLRAVDRLNLRVEEGEVLGLLGANGSGKSTTIKLLLGLIEPTAGECEIFSVSSRDAACRRDVGYLPDSPSFAGHCSGPELLRFHGRLGGLGGRTLEDRIVEVVELVGLGAAGNRRVGTYSKGMLQRIGLAQALVHRPRLLILDEPVAALDVAGIAAIVELIGRLKAEGQTVLLTSHVLGPIEQVCDRVGIMDHGRLVFEGTLAGRSHALALDAFSPGDVAELRDWCEVRGKPFELQPGRGMALARLLEETGTALARR